MSGVSLNLTILVINMDNPIILLGITSVLLSFGFKLGLSPSLFWIPDTYEGFSWDILSRI